MAQRRMTSLEVTDTDAFLDMGQGAQLLYFHLNSRADDDGFVANPKKILRAIGGNEDDLKLLIIKKFLIAFEDGVCVIKHWRINNFVRKDLYKETKYLDHRQALFIRANGAYTLSDDGSGMKLPPKHYTLDYVDETLTERQLRIGKDRVGENTANAEIIEVSDSEESTRVVKTPKYPNAREAFSWFERPQKSWNINTTELKHGELLFERGEKNVKRALSFLAENDSHEFCPKVTKPSDLERKWQDILAFKEKNGL